MSARILIVAPAWVGDAVLAQPLFARLKERYPGVTITVLAPPWVLPVLQRMPEVDATVENPFDHGTLAVAERRRFAKVLAGRYDHAIVLPNSFKSALIPFFAGIPLRTGYIGEARFGLLNDRRRLDEKMLPLMVERFAALAQPKGEALRRPLPEPRLVVDAKSRDATLAKFGLDLAQPVVAFAPGAEYGPAKRWPAAHYGALAAALADAGADVIVLGSAKERSIGDEVVARAANARVRNLCGATSLADVVDLLAGSDVAVSNDSGLLHVAAAAGASVVAIYGSSSPKFTPPLTDAAAVVALEIECSPCFARECPLKHLRCLNDLTPATVLRAVDTLRANRRSGGH